MKRETIILVDKYIFSHNKRKLWPKLNNQIISLDLSKRGPVRIRSCITDEDEKYNWWTILGKRRGAFL